MIFSTFSSVSAFLGSSLRTPAVALVAVGLAGTLSVACSPASESEGLRHTSSKLLAPEAIVKVTASEDTLAKTGIATFRLYAGKRETIITGYDAKGRAVRGIALGFVGQTAATSAHVRVSALDASGFATSCNFATPATASGNLSSATSVFLDLAARDVAAAADNAKNGKGGASASSCESKGLDTASVTLMCTRAVAKGVEKSVDACVKAAMAVSTTKKCGGSSSSSSSVPGKVEGKPSSNSDDGVATGMSAEDAQKRIDEASKKQTCASCVKGGDDDLKIDPKTGDVSSSKEEEAGDGKADGVKTGDGKTDGDAKTGETTTGGGDAKSGDSEEEEEDVGTSDE